MADLDAVRRVFQKDRFANEVCGIEILEATPGRAICEMKITDAHMNAGNVVQGGAIFTLGDFTYAIASNCGGTIAVTLDTCKRSLLARRSSRNIFYQSPLLL